MESSGHGPRPWQSVNPTFFNSPPMIPKRLGFTQAENEHVIGTITVIRRNTDHN